MLKLIRFILIVCFALAFTPEAYAKPEYIFLENTVANKNKKNIYEADFQKQIIEMIENSLSLANHNPYRTIRVRQIYNDHQQLKSVIVYLLSTTTKSVELIRINLNQHLQPVTIIKHYQLQPADLAQSPFYSQKIEPECPDERVQFVIGNNFYKDESVNREILNVFSMAQSKGYNPMLMNINDRSTPRPTVRAYLNWLSCPNVKGFYNESHGWKQGILLDDDDFVYSMVDKQLSRKLNHDVILFDSCETFHNPLLYSMTNQYRGDSQQYIAGFIMLPFGPSERTASCIWYNAFNHVALTQDLIRTCAKRFGLNPEGFKIAGNGDNYLSWPT